MKKIKEIPFDLKLLKSGDKILVRTKGFFQIVSKAIRVITKSFFNHVCDVIIEYETLPAITFASGTGSPFSYTYKMNGEGVPVVATLSDKATYKPKKIKKIYVIEALFKGGVVKSPIEKYMNTKRYDVKIVRFKEELFEKRIDKESKLPLLDSFIKLSRKISYKNAIRVNIRRLKKNMGKKYDYFAVAWIGVKTIIRGLLNKIPLVNKIPQISGNPCNFRQHFFCSENSCVCAYKLPNSKVDNPFAGKKHPKQTCSTITPCDIGKSKYVFYVAGSNKV